MVLKARLDCVLSVLHLGAVLAHMVLDSNLTSIDLRMYQSEDPGVTPDHGMTDIEDSFQISSWSFLQAQAIFFTPAVLPVYDAFKWMGVMAVGIASFQLLLWFPMWGGLIFPAKKGATEQDYYFAEYNEAERMEGLHLQVSKFVSHSLVNFSKKLPDPW